MKVLNKFKYKYNNLSAPVKASFWFLVCSFLQKGISTITTPIFTRLLSTSEYGQFNVFNSWMGIIAIFVTLRLSYGVYAQGLVKFEEDRARFSSSMQGLNFALCFIWLLIYIIFRKFWNNLFSLTTLQMLSMFVLIWADAVFEFWAAEQRVTYSYKHLVLLTMIVSIAKPTLGVVLVTHATDRVTARILGLVIVELIGYGFLFIIQIKKGKQIFSRFYWKYAVLFNIPLIPHYLSQTVLNSADRIMIQDMVGSNEAGIYSLAYSLALLMTLVSTSLMNTVSPWIYQKIKKDEIYEIKKVGYITLEIVAFFNILLIAFAPEAVAIFAPRSYYEAIYVIPPVTMSVYFMYCYDLFARFEFYYEKTVYIMFASIVGAILNIILNYIFIKLYGYIAAGYTTLICYFVYAVMHYVIMMKICRNQIGEIKVYDSKKLIKITFIFLTICFAYLCTYNNILIRYALTITLTVICVINRNRIKHYVNQILNIRRKQN